MTEIVKICLELERVNLDKTKKDDAWTPSLYFVVVLCISLLSDFTSLCLSQSFSALGTLNR